MTYTMAYWKDDPNLNCDHKNLVKSAVVIITVPVDVEIINKSEIKKSTTAVGKFDFNHEQAKTWCTDCGLVIKNLSFVDEIERELQLSGSHQSKINRIKVVNRLLDQCSLHTAKAIVETLYCNSGYGAVTDSLSYVTKDQVKKEWNL